MLRASWALISFPIIPGARSRLERSLPGFFPSSVRLWRQDRHFAPSARIFAAKTPPADPNLVKETPGVSSDDHTKVPENGPDTSTPSIEIPPSFRVPPFPLATVEDLEPKPKVLPDTDTNIFEPPTLEYRARTRVQHPSVHIQGPTSLDATPEVSSNNNPQISENDPEPSLSFRSPPFPLATVEELKLEPKISAEPNRNRDTNVFEPTTLEYRAYERLPQHSVDILTQVAQSLPEILPEPETEDGSIFEDNSHDDYAGISTSSTPPITSTQSLEMLVTNRIYDEATRVLDTLRQVGTRIPPSFTYEEAAIWAVTSPQTLRPRWTPRFKHPSSFRTKKFYRLRKRIMLSPFNSLRLIMEFGLIAAEKGYARSTCYDVVALVCMYSDPNATLRYIDELRGCNRRFLEQLTAVEQSTEAEQATKAADVDALDNKLRVDIVGAAVRTLANAGRFDHAVQLIPDPTETRFHLMPDVYHYLVQKMEMTRNPRYIPHINFVTQHKTEARHRSLGLKKMDKPDLALAIRCLANIGQFDLAIGLLPKFLGDDGDVESNSHSVWRSRARRDGILPALPGAPSMAEPEELSRSSIKLTTLDFLLARLRESEHDGHSIYFDHISQLRAATEPTPAITDSAPGITDSAVSRSDTPDVEPRRPTLVNAEYGRAIRALTKAWCLEEAVALMPAYTQGNTSYHKKLYNLLLWKLKSSYNPKYRPYVAKIEELRERAVTQATQGKAIPRVASEAESSVNEELQEARLTTLAEKSISIPSAEADAANEADSAKQWDFSGEDIFMASSVSSSKPLQSLESTLAASLRELRKALRARFPLAYPHPLTVVRFLDAYLASGRSRAILLLRNLALSCGARPSLLYFFAEMLFHARRGNSDLVIQTFVTHFFIVGLPRDDLLIRLRNFEPDPATEALWGAKPENKLFPHRMHAAVVWRALLQLTHEKQMLTRDKQPLEALYAKLLRFADLNTPQSSVLAAGVPLLHPPPSWKAGVDASVFTPFIRRMCRAFGTERGALILKDMVRLGIEPNIYQLTELAIAYSRVGEVRRTLLLLDQVENATKAWESVDEDSSQGNENEAQRILVPRVDQVFYVAVVRGFLISKRIAEARSVEQRMYKRYGYVPGESQHLDELYEDLQTAEAGMKISPRQAVISSPKYEALPDSALSLDLALEPPTSAGV
ncbi:hypothetical protein K438DRAFT_2030807 [Mycena galopus ATCC 62051]|nr:hypothetical protein K438DRAFT_2030807 [Mycena galopus ATCC 62051]